MPRFSLRSLMAVIIGACLVLGTVQMLSRWLIKQDKIARALEQQQRLDSQESDQLIRDLGVIRAKLGRYPKTEAELVDLRGKPMPVTHSEDNVTQAVAYKCDEPYKNYALVFRWSSTEATDKSKVSGTNYVN